LKIVWILTYNKAQLTSYKKKEQSKSFLFSHLIGLAAWIKRWHSLFLQHVSYAEGLK